MCHLELHEAAPVHNQSITGAAVSLIIAHNSATAAAQKSKLAARLDRTAPVDVGRPANHADCPGRKLAKRKRNSAAETGEQKLDARTTGAGRWRLRNKVRQPAIKLW